MCYQIKLNSTQVHLKSVIKNQYNRMDYLGLRGRILALEKLKACYRNNEQVQVHDKIFIISVIDDLIETIQKNITD